MSRLLTMPIPSFGLGRRARSTLRTIARRGWPVLAGLALLGLGALLWEAHIPTLLPRHRPEALTFSLARSRFSPPMAVEPNAALVRGRFSEQTPALVAAREAMGFTDDMIMQQRTSRVGDYEVTSLWLRLPGLDGGHWLVVAWMEDSDLALCSFRFTSAETDLTGDELLWGQRLLRSILVPENFRRGVVPQFSLRGAMPKTFGPTKAS